MKLRLWNDLYLIQDRYIVIMGTPYRTSSLFVLNGLDVQHPSNAWSSTSTVSLEILISVNEVQFLKKFFQFHQHTPRKGLILMLHIPQMFIFCPHSGQN